MPDSTSPITPVFSDTSAAEVGPSNLRLRVTYGAIGAVLLLGSVWFSPWTFGLFFTFVQTVMLWEFYRMMRVGRLHPAGGIGIGLGLLVFVGTFWFARIGYGLSGESATALDAFFNVINGLYLRLLWTGLAVLVPVILLLREMMLWPRYASPFGNAGAVLIGVFYISVPMALLSLLAQGGNGYDYRRIFALLFLIWASDIGAYAAGKAFGKRKLAPAISPGKTWEGWAGGFLLTLVVGWALQFMLPDMPLVHRLVVAGVVAVFGPLGDLAESMLKRSVGVKDSGSIMPGHGGLLDRFDAFLLVLPVLAVLQLLVG